MRHVFIGTIVWFLAAGAAFADGDIDALLKCQDSMASFLKGSRGYGAYTDPAGAASLACARGATVDCIESTYSHMFYNHTGNSGDSRRAHAVRLSLQICSGVKPE